MLKSKHLLGLKDLTAEEIELILDTAAPMKEIIQRDIKKVPTLRGKLVVTLFYEPSTRTRTSFELAAKYMGADTASIATATSSVTKGESLRDTAETLAAMGTDAVIIRHSAAGSPLLLTRYIQASVINGGDGMHEHPTQALLDLFTIKEKRGTIKGLKVAILGDILHSRVARSNIWGLTKLGAEVRVAGPPTLIPPGIEKLGVKVFYRVEDALQGVDVINVLRIQRERQKRGLFPSLREYALLYELTPERLRLAKPDALVLHPGPMNRGVEIAPAVADSLQSAVREQVTNGVAIRMALLYLLIGGGSQ
ncbi:MAG: aspartate carbamoyltransferase catalytic subunit [Thermoanaerobacteraceae bacterium]|uniref:aspartate carbamoyltransferase catalytic subunit n=1 Tax=Thermanaeromonas sp. C210 TaxID=2731925 RepID=UPI00155CC2B7|nr:aspartate carbamoyltransferase catalytic subunit [Thermanaeromonas sp. C210]MBE3581021.1 aspartate carbamoyltransferase catalytic subunit [Thermoanaerobacteraceae bacterium]GFN24042.1 aspartate carbamoyltransferase [Thermanaeromonas sp. C210]